MEVPLADTEEAANLGYFFKTAGATRFTQAASGHQQQTPGYASTVVVAQRFGVVVFSDLQGEWHTCCNSVAPALAMQTTADRDQKPEANHQPQPPFTRAVRCHAVTIVAACSGVCRSHPAAFGGVQAAGCQEVRQQLLCCSCTAVAGAAAPAGDLLQRGGCVIM